MRRCASKDAGPQRGVDLGAIPHRLEEGKSASEDAEPRRGVDCDVPHWLGRRTNHHLQGCGNLSLADAFYSLEGKPKKDMDLGSYK